MTTALICGLASTFAIPDADLARHVYPLSKPIAAPRIELDAKAAPDLQVWGERARDLATAWFPHVCQLLSTGDFKPPKRMRFVFREKQGAPAYCAGDEISFSVDWVRAHPEDFGMVIHEMVHVIQAYPANAFGAGWVTEGIADWVRWWRFEPEAMRWPRDVSRSSYRDGYGTTAYFLAWAMRKYDARLIPELDLAMRKAEDPADVFVRRTGKKPDELWAEFQKAVTGN